MSSWPNHLQSPGVPSHTQVRGPQSAMRHQEQPPVQVLWSPHSAMEAMNQSGQPRKSGKRGPMQPAPLTSGGLTLEEITCREWGPHLFFFSFFFFCLRMWRKKMELKSPKLHTPREVGTCHPPLTKIWESRYLEPQPHPTMWLRRGPGCRRPSNP